MISLDRDTTQRVWRGCLRDPNAREAFADIRHIRVTFGKMSRRPIRVNPELLALARKMMSLCALSHLGTNDQCKALITPRNCLKQPNNNAVFLLFFGKNNNPPQRHAVTKR
ncbi:MAG: hypothetical protein Q7S57_02945 [bacterium]|nr:hypothetical protein [bacterium]